MSTQRFLTIITLGLCMLSWSEADAQCTPESTDNRRLAEEFATGTGSSAGKSRPSGVPVVQADQVRLLTNGNDAATCQQLFNRYMGLRRDPETAPVGRHWTFYRVGDLYYVVVGWSTPPVSQSGDTVYMRHGWTPIIILDSRFQVLGTVAL